jgi:hypothetical protein
MDGAGEKHPLGGDRPLRRGPGGIDELIAPGLDWAGPRLLIIDDARPQSDTIRLFSACPSNPHREPRPALPEACEVPSRATPCQAGRLGSGARGNFFVEANPTRSLRTEHGQMPRTYRKGIVGAVIAVRMDSTGRVRKLGWSSRLCTDKDSQPPRIVAEAHYQRLTGRLSANGKRCETHLRIAQVRVGSWADETSRIGRF